MSLRDVAALGVRLIAVYTLVPAFGVANFFFDRGEVPPAASLASPIALLLLGAVLWIAAPSLVGAIGTSRRSLNGIGRDLHLMAEALFGVLGIVLAVHAASDFAHTVVNSFVGPTHEDFPRAIFASATVIALAQLLVGATVFIGRRGLFKVFAAVRNY